MKKLFILITIFLAIVASSIAQTQTTPTHLKFKNGISTDSIGSYTGDSLIIDGEGKLKLSDDIAGEYTLSELATGADSSWVKIEVDTITGLTNQDHNLIFTENEGDDQFFIDYRVNTHILGQLDIVHILHLGNSLFNTHLLGQ